MGGLIVMASGFGPEGRGSIANATNDPLRVVYVLVKAMVPYVAWSFLSSLPWVLSLKKN